MPHPDVVVGGEGRDGEGTVGLDLQEREVGLFVAAEDLGGVAGLSARDRDFDLLRFLHHVLIGEDLPIRRGDEPRAGYLIASVVHPDDGFDVDDQGFHLVGDLDDAALEGAELVRIGQGRGGEEGGEQAGEDSHGHLFGGPRG